MSKLENLKMKVMASLNLFAMSVEVDRYDDRSLERFTNRMMEDFSDELAALRKKIEEQRATGNPLSDDYFKIQMPKVTIGEHRIQAYNNAIDDILQLIDEV